MLGGNNQGMTPPGGMRAPTEADLPPLRKWRVRMPDFDTFSNGNKWVEVIGHSSSESESGTLTFTRAIIYQDNIIAQHVRGFAQHAWFEYEEDLGYVAPVAGEPVNAVAEVTH